MDKQIHKVSMVKLLPIILSSLENNQTVEIKVTGNSMKPIFKHHETFVGLKKFHDDLNKNRIYLYKYNNNYLLHRFIKTKNNKLYFQGDALNTYEYPLKEDIVALVIYMINNHKRQSPYSFKSMFNYYLSKLIKKTAIIIKKIIRRTHA